MSDYSVLLNEFLSSLHKSEALFHASDLKPYIWQSDKDNIIVAERIIDSTKALFQTFRDALDKVALAYTNLANYPAFVLNGDMTRIENLISRGYDGSSGIRMMENCLQTLDELGSIDAKDYDRISRAYTAHTKLQSLLKKYRSFPESLYQHLANIADLVAHVESEIEKAEGLPGTMLSPWRANELTYESVMPRGSINSNKPLTASYATNRVTLLE
jgi:hypothetical protein